MHNAACPAMADEVPGLGRTHVPQRLDRSMELREVGAAEECLTSPVELKKGPPPLGLRDLASIDLRALAKTGKADD